MIIDPAKFLYGTIDSNYYLLHYFFIQLIAVLIFGNLLIDELIC